MFLLSNLNTRCSAFLILCKMVVIAATASASVSKAYEWWTATFFCLTYNKYMGFEFSLGIYLTHMTQVLETLPKISIKWIPKVLGKSISRLLLK